MTQLSRSRTHVLPNEAQTTVTHNGHAVRVRRPIRPARPRTARASSSSGPLWVRKLAFRLNLLVLPAFTGGVLIVR
ncbi:MAG TPA: hypothetical protein VF551_04435 [Chthoniobacterales bacterium]